MTIDAKLFSILTIGFNEDVKVANKCTKGKLATSPAAMFLWIKFVLAIFVESCPMTNSVTLFQY